MYVQIVILYSFIKDPNDRAIFSFYKQAESRRFWIDKLAVATDEMRLNKIIKPRFQWVIDSTQEYASFAQHWVDVHTNQQGYIEEMAKQEFFSRKTFLQPLIEVDCNNVDVHNACLNQTPLAHKADVVSLFEVLDHVSNVDGFLKSITENLNDNGLIFVTCILGSGFDVQALWDKAQNIYPPDRLNVFSVEGIHALAKRLDLEVLELSTPGILDLEIVAKAVDAQSNDGLARFVQYLTRNRNEDIQQAFQDFLQENRLSSYGRIVLKKGVN